MKLADAMGTAGKTMSDMNRIMKPEQIAATVNAFSRENMKMAMTDEMSKLYLPRFLEFAKISDSKKSRTWNR